MTVYLDIVFIENIIMNYIILCATGIVCKNKVKQQKILISSIIGSIYAIAYYIIEVQGYINVILKILLSIVMVYIAFEAKGLKKLFKYIIIFYLTSFAFGGCALALLYYMGPKNLLYEERKIIGIYPLKSALLGRNYRLWYNKYFI